MNKECDLVMKGGVTSGVVYPRAVLDLSRTYRFRQIGGASAGAIAAAFAAAAEANRAGGGFDRLAEIPNQLEKRLGDLFQPYPTYRRLFERLLETLDNGKTPGVWFVIRNILAIRKAIKRLPGDVFGICPGTTTSPGKGPALIDWMNRQLEYVAGNIESANDPLPEVPLNFGQLAKKGVTLRLITTNLSQRRPENLPLGTGFGVSRKDLDWLLPENVAGWLKTWKGETPDLAGVPPGDDMPVLLAVRMSLSFPVLFSAVPLYMPDRSLRLDDGKCKGANNEQKRNLFSDGGLSSNFPIHYFDAPLPLRPTFAINLSEFHECRHGRIDTPWNRIYMPAQARGGLTYTINPINNITTFLGALLNAAKDWQDAMQMRMPAYRERIVHVALTDEEGGLNLNMGEDKVRQLTGYGALAAERIVEGHQIEINKQPPFNLDAHRWRRLLAITDALDEALTDMVRGYQDPAPSGDPALGSLEHLLERLATLPRNDPAFGPLGYRPRVTSDIPNLIARWRALAQLQNDWKNLPLHHEWRRPHPKTGVKFRPREF